ncbi:MAG: hypothetical protein KJ970_11375 [Candidatus Eisenbacteria bacterium]|uniref:Doubled CXXCH motif domain-containing protein n=1 Tax=Eiseniibacteriota bacterium TaxID=2212470 RepID=A0A948RXT0_UNCEI|nr:hypothetical protein [Candidatus Eisenbacteria bacterium]MBU1949010.1 hypothetical protein [Candidatus Eisenbacteria bacterium]MBU2691517.1 hypothetical protein [Candidatus Eisenbacteria bacterium]
MRLVQILAVALFLVACVTMNALAFHDGGVAECAGCHTMHNSQDGAPIDADHPAGNPYLLKFANSTDMCLSCHADYGQFYSGEGYGPGGDFYWVTKTWEWSAHGHANASTGDSHGHNVISPAGGISADATLSMAPGGDFDSDYLTCTSCHDPHGNQNFRILYGSAIGPVYDGGRYNFTEEAPIAEGNSRRTYVGSGGEETHTQHTIYKSGMSEWCANCHETFHAGNTTNFVHPTGEDMGTAASSTYNAYISSDEPTGGNASTAYNGLVPFEAVNVVFDDVDPGDYTQGPTSADQVMCVTCHRAHATPFADIGRWDFGTTFIAESHPLATDTGASTEDVANKYYQYTFSTNQRSLCNKCHVKDAGDAPL